MAIALQNEIVQEFQTFDIDVKRDSVLEKLSNISREYQLNPSNLCDEWVAFSKQNNDCDLDSENTERFDVSLRSKSKTHKTPLSKSRGIGQKMFNKDDIETMFDDDEIIGQYATPEDTQRLKSQKRAAEQTIATTPSSKIRHKHNETTPTATRSTFTATPTRIYTQTSPTVNGTTSTPFRLTDDSGTPATKYSQRKTKGQSVASLNTASLPSLWMRTACDMDTVQPIPLKNPVQYMFQKVPQKALALINRVETFGKEICQFNNLPDPLSVYQQSLDPVVYTGLVACEGEGHLNARSCLLQGPAWPARKGNGFIRLNIPDSLSCSLFPGQVIAVEGINNYHGMLIPSKIYDEGVLPPLPIQDKNIEGFTMIAAAGPFTTSDNLEMEPLLDLLEIVKSEKPNVLLLLGPFVDATHQQIKECDLPPEVTIQSFFEDFILEPIFSICSAQKSKVILIPSQRDIHHPYCVYPQPPFNLPSKYTNFLVSFSDPATLIMNGLYLGLTSTDILFHLSARTMFKGPSGDRMSKIVSHILRQKCYYPLLPAYRKETRSAPIPTSHVSEPPMSNEVPSTSSKSSDTTSTTIEYARQQSMSVEAEEETTEVNINLIDAYENGYAMLSVRPHILLLPSDLKPFVKVLDGCICVNPGRLTKKASGGTFMKVNVPNIVPTSPDISSKISMQVVHI